MTKREYQLIQVIQLAVLAIVGFVVISDMIQRRDPWWLAAGLMAALAVLLNRWPKQRYHLYLVAHAALSSGLMILNPSFVIFGFTFCATATALLPDRTAVFWIALMSLATGAVFIIHSGWIGGLLTTLAIVGGYVSISLFNYTRIRSDRDRRKSETLLQELRTAHRQLEDYAVRVEELAAAEERNRLAREMHDTLGHRLTVAAVQLEGAQRLIPTDPDRAARMVGTVHDQVHEALDQLRRTVAALRTPLEADLPLPRAIERLASGFQQATGLSVHLLLSDDVSALAVPHRLALYRATQEALTNVQRHAQAQSVWIELVQREAGLVLTIGDDGIGFPGDVEEMGFGLLGMRERVGQLGGKLELETRSGGGAQIVICLPLPAEESND